MSDVRLVRHHAYGAAAVLAVDEVPEPVPGAGELAVAVEVAGVTWPAVAAVVAGDPDRLPAAPAGEVCGRVVGVGEGVDHGWLGRRVAGTAFSGAYADVALLAVAVAVAVPDDIDAETAVAVVRGGQVALGALEAGEHHDARRVLVTGASGGVGHLAVQLARGAGRRVTGAVSTPNATSKAALLGELGVDEIVTYEQTWAPPDLVVDGVGGTVQTSALATLAPGGRLVVYNAAGGPVDTDELRARGQAVIGFSLAQVVRHGRPAFDRRARDLWGHVRAGTLRAHVDTVPLDRAADAHDRLRERRGVGKCALRVSAAGAPHGDAPTRRRSRPPGLPDVAAAPSTG